MMTAKTVFAAALGVSVLALAAGPVAAEEIRYGLWAAEGEAQYEGALEFKRVVEEGSDHTVTIYPSNQLGTPREMIAQLALGSTQVMSSGDPGIKEVEYLALPYLMKSIANYEAIMGSEIGDEWNDKLINERQIRLLGFMPRSPRQISANKPIETMADLSGLKLRAPERDYYVESLSALGANPTPMAFKEVYTALQTGVVDGQENPIETIYAQKFYEVQEGVAMVDYIIKPAYVMISEAFWSGLSDEDKASDANGERRFDRQDPGAVTRPGEALHCRDGGSRRRDHLSRQDRVHRSHPIGPRQTRHRGLGCRTLCKDRRDGSAGYVK